MENYHDSINTTAVAQRHHQGFSGVRALENVQLDLWPGKVTALSVKTARANPRWSK
jgi:ABC-type sugar transport system ATPase subunit